MRPTGQHQEGRGWPRGAGILPAVAILLAALAVLAVGCGGDDDGEPPAAEPQRSEDPLGAPEAESPDEDDARDERPAGAEPGEGAAGEQAGPRRISRAQFVARADRLCTRKRRQLAEELAEQARGAGSEGAGLANPYSGALTEMIREIADGVADLPEPRSGPSPTRFVEAQRRYASVLGQLGEQVGSLDPQALGDADAERIRRLSTEMQRVGGQLASRAEEQGFEVCGGI